MSQYLRVDDCYFYCEFLYFFVILFSRVNLICLNLGYTKFYSLILVLTVIISLPLIFSQTGRRSSASRCAAGESFAYRSVMLIVLCPASLAIVNKGTPPMASQEQNVCLNV